MSSTIQLMNLEEQMILQDEIKNTASQKHNFIVVRDAESGAVLFVRKNLVVRSGRELILRKLFGIPYASETVSLLNDRIINFFSIGTGGTPSADPFNPISPTPADSDLNYIIPFRSATAEAPISSSDLAYYADPRVSGSETQYFKKKFTSQTIVKDDVNDEYYNKIVLDVTASEARGRLVNELALYSSRASSNTFVDFKIATRITFQTESLQEATQKALSIEYYVYA